MDSWNWFYGQYPKAKFCLFLGFLFTVIIIGLKIEMQKWHQNLIVHLSKNMSEVESSSFFFMELFIWTIEPWNGFKVVRQFSCWVLSIVFFQWCTLTRLQTHYVMMIHHHLMIYQFIDVEHIAFLSQNDALCLLCGFLSSDVRKRHLIIRYGRGSYMKLLMCIPYRGDLGTNMT